MVAPAKELTRNAEKHNFLKFDKDALFVLKAILSYNLKDHCEFISMLGINFAPNSRPIYHFCPT